MGAVQLSAVDSCVLLFPILLLLEGINVRRYMAQMLNLN